MKALVFAGGSGKRFWPLGRESLPKQFIRMINGKSTFEHTIDRVLRFLRPEDVFIFTHEKYKKFAYEHGKKIPKKNFYFEPFRRDVGPAVGYANIVMRSLGFEKEPVVVMWADHVVTKVDAFVDVMREAEDLVRSNSAKGVLVGVKPRYPATNLGWIAVEPTEKEGVYKFEGFVYRPDLEQAQNLFKTNRGLWNTAYFISTPEYILSFYKEYYPDLWEGLKQVERAMESGDRQAFVDAYGTLEEVHFDYVVYYNLDPQETLVVGEDMGWLDIGTMESLREYHKGDWDEHGNVVQGLGKLFDSSESMIINQEQGKLVVGVGVEDIIIVNTKDAILVLNDSKSKLVSDVVSTLKDDEDLSKYVK